MAKNLSSMMRCPDCKKPMKGGKCPECGMKGMARGTGPVPDENAPLGEGGRFAVLTKKTGSPGLSAFIGRKKFGKAKFQKMAAKGKKG
jgi:hypothetical protein